MAELCAQLIILAACLTGPLYDAHDPAVEQRILSAAAAQPARGSQPEPPTTTEPLPAWVPDTWREDGWIVTATPDGWVIAPPPLTIEAVPEPWATLADCESGDWLDGGRTFTPGSARWAWGAPGTTLPPWGTRLHHGGLQHHPTPGGG